LEKIVGKPGSSSNDGNSHETRLNGLSTDVNTNKTKIASLESKATNGVYIKTDKVAPITIGFNI
jgi:hypothetical protein